MLFLHTSLTNQSRLRHKFTLCRFRSDCIPTGTHMKLHTCKGGLRPPTLLWQMHRCAFCWPAHLHPLDLLRIVMTVSEM